MTKRPMQKIPAPIVGLYSPAPGSGKSTLAQALTGSGFRAMKFAAPLKNMVRSLLRDAGCPENMVERYVEGDLKEEPCPYLGGHTSRHTQRTVGTEWGREHMGETFWLDMVMGGADRARNAGIPVVIDDVRFLNEGRAIRAAGGILVRITRPGLVVAAPAGHASEGALDSFAFDLEITNDAACATAFGTKWARIVEAVAYGRPELCG